MTDPLDEAIADAEFDAALAAVPHEVRHRSFMAALVAFERVGLRGRPT